MGIARGLLWGFVAAFLLVLGGFLVTSGFAVWSYAHEGRCFAWNPIGSLAELLSPPPAPLY